MLVRTVFDGRARSSKYLHHVLVLAASWHCHARRGGARRMEVAVVGRAPDPLREFLGGLGIGVLGAEPDPNDAWAPTSNSIVGALAGVGDERVLLLDNDIAFLRDPSLLDTVPDDALAAAVAGHERVSPRQWDIIEEALGLVPPARTWTSPQREREALVEGRDPPAPIPRLYLNGGVLLMPRGPAFPLLWRRHVELIARLFEHRPEGTRAVRGSNQAGLATAAATWSRYVLLPLAYNYRPVCFALGTHAAEEIALLHLAGGYEVPGAASTTERLRAYWRTMIDAPIEAVRARVAPAAHEARRAAAAACLDELIRLCRAYDLDATARRCAEAG